MSSSRSIFVRFFPSPPPLLFFFIQFLFFTSHVLNFLFLFPIPLVIHFLLRSHVSFLLSLRVLPFAIAFILYGVCSTVYLFFFFSMDSNRFPFLFFFLFFCTYFRKFWLFSRVSRASKNLWEGKFIFLFPSHFYLVTKENFSKLIFLISCIFTPIEFCILKINYWYKYEREKKFCNKPAELYRHWKIV